MLRDSTPLQRNDKLYDFSILSTTATRAESVLHQRIYLLILGGKMEVYPCFFLHKETPYLLSILS